ncbi:ABC transporter ATP-binding protein [Pseudarthrobacter defluvii]|uniref:ABC transporter ATP-binding protein n=1 Tax=Pseudarthrobacter defluvii TaxID=410837 RepID=UPI0025756CE8|nr:ABC transporter ATP-binding protein [Pseudarthrobacter defluvii]WJH25129.1 ABC transporter ATP-binding protein [Pseudarthrobacter defluvii]
MLSARQLHAKGRRDPLLPPTSLTVRRGGLLLVTGERQDQRTALSLLLSGRMKASGGDVSWDNSPRTKQLRLAAALVDSPGVNEPEEHLSVRDLVTEDLALIPRRYRGALLSGPWLKVNRFEDIADLWTEQLEPQRRLELLTALALANPRTDLLVVDSPDRHSADGLTWLPRLQELAYDAGRPLAVVAAVSAVPAWWDGPVAAIGNEVPAPVLSDGSDPLDDDHADDDTASAGSHPGKHAAEAGQDPEHTRTTLETEVAK